MKPFFLFSREESDTKVANDRLFSYAVGLAGQNITYNFISNRLFVFLNTVKKIPSEKTGIITGISTLWDAINDPLIGSIMDHRKHKPGNKMRPFLLWTPIIIGIITVFMFADFGFNETQTIIFVLCMYILFDLFYSYQDIAIWGMAALSSPDSEERRRVAQWISIGAGAGGTIGGLFPMFKDMLVSSEKMTEEKAYFSGAILLGVGGMAIAMLAYRMKEKVENNPDKTKGVFQSLLNLRYNKTLIIICIARIVQSFSLTLPWEYFFETEGISYNVMGATISGGTAQVVYGYIMGIPGAILMFFAVPMIKKMGGNKNLLLYSELIAIGARIIAYFIGANGRFMRIGPMLAVMAILGTSQILTNMKDIAHRSLLTNSIDEMELKTGERTEGITFSFQNFVSKVTGAIPKFIQGYLLKFLGFDQNITVKPGKTVIGSQVAPRFLKYRWEQFILGPVIGAVLYVIAIWFLEDNSDHIAEVEKQLKERRALAHANAQATSEA